MMGSICALFQRLLRPAGIAILLVLGGLSHCGLAQDQLTDSPMSLSGFSPSQSYEVEDFQPVGLDDEFLIRLLYRIGKVSTSSLASFEAYSKEIPLSRVREDPRRFRFWVRSVSGKVEQVRKHRIAEKDPGGSLKGCFEVDVSTSDGPAKVFTRSIPDSWLGSKTADPAGQPVLFSGFFFKLLKKEDDGEGEPVVAYVANRLRWFPAQENLELGIKASHVLLAKAGVDAAGFDDVRKQNTKYLSDSDAECFYQMLAASREIDRLDLPGDRAGFVELVKNSRKHFGDAVSLSGRVRRCIPIEIESAPMQESTGLTRYYELDLFYLLDDQRVVINGVGDKEVADGDMRGADGEKKIEYRHRFPVTVCVAELPENTTPADIEDHLVQIDGFFFRFWKYQSEFTGSDGAQISPLVIGLKPQVVEQSAGLLDGILTFMLLAILLGAVAMFLIYRRTDRNPNSRGGTAALPEKIEVGNFDAD